MSRQLLNHQDNRINQEFAQVYDAIDLKTTLPIGSVILLYSTAAANQSPPTGWLTCDGSQRSIQEFPELFRVIGNNYTPSGSTLATGAFALPLMTPVLPGNAVGANSLMYYIIKAK